MRDHPVIKLTLIFVIGIISTKFIFINIYILLSLLLLSILLIIAAKSLKENKVLFHLVAFILAIFIFSIGNHYSYINQRSISPQIKDIDKVKDVTVTGIINKIDLIRKNELILYVSTDSIFAEKLFISDEVLLLCKIQLDANSLYNLYANLEPGNRVNLKGFYYKGRERRNPGEFDYNAYLNSNSIAGILKISDSKSVQITSTEQDILKNTLHQIRKAIDEQLKKYHDLETFSLLRGLLLADRGEISYETKTHFVDAGVIHVLAVSGLNVGFIVLIFLLIFGRMNLFFRSGITIAGLIFYLVLTGATPSVFRATVMAVVLIVAFLSNRSTHLINSIAIAALVILIIDPNELYDAGFQLSFAAVISMMLIYPFIETIINRLSVKNKIIKYFLVAIGLSLSAQIGTLPFTFYYFSKFSTVSLFANLIVIPAIGVITGIGIVTLIFSPLIPPISIYFGAANNILTGWLFDIINFAGSLKFSYINIYDYSLVDSILFYVISFITIILYMKLKHKVLKIITVVLFIINIFVYSKIDDRNLLPDNYLSIMMIDVGQGDSFLIKFPNGKTALVDAGNTTSTFDNGERVIVPLLNYLGVNKIDYGIISHIDTDHYGGFVELVLQGMIGEVFKPEIDTSLSKDKRFEEFTRKRGIPIRYFKEEKMAIGNAAIYFLYDEKIKNISGESTNNRSGLFKIVYGETNFLFTGDVEKDVEKFYSDKYRYFLDSDVLKVGHHGSKTSSSNEFVKYVSPEFSLISAGFKNKFGHPVEDVIQRLEAEGSTIYRTDLNKAVILRSDGQDIKLINW
jgi:competence protein ComEC